MVTTMKTTTGVDTEGQLRTDALSSSAEALVTACVGLEDVTAQMREPELRAALSRWNALRAAKREAQDMLEAAVDLEFGPMADPSGARQIVVHERWRATLGYKTIDPHQAKSQRRRYIKLEDFGGGGGS